MVFGIGKSPTPKATASDVDELHILAKDHADEIRELKEFVRQSEDAPRFFASDIHIFRFLKRKDMNVAAAKQMIAATLAYERQKIRVTLRDFNVAMIKRHYPHGWHGLCKQGRPVYIESLGQLNIKSLFELLSLDEMVRYLMLDTETSMLHRFPITSLLGGKLITNSTMVFDLHGVSMSMCTDRRIHDLLRRALKMAGEHFPEAVGRILICRAPRAFSTLWFLIKCLLQGDTASRIEVHSGFGPLYDWIDRANLPQEFGGTSTRGIGDDHGPWLDENYQALVANIPHDEIERLTYSGTSIDDLLRDQVLKDQEASDHVPLPLVSKTEKSNSLDCETNVGSGSESHASRENSAASFRLDTCEMPSPLEPEVTKRESECAPQNIVIEATAVHPACGIFSCSG